MGKMENGMDTKQDQDWYVVSYDKEKGKLAIEGGPMDHLHAIWKRQEVESRMINELPEADPMQEAEEADGPADGGQAYDDDDDDNYNDYYDDDDDDYYRWVETDWDRPVLIRDNVVGIVKYSPHGSIPGTEPGC